MENEEKEILAKINIQKLICPSCGSENPIGNKYCLICGSVLQKEKSRSGISVESLFSNNSSKFAQGLPTWNIEPPQIMVRRH